MYEFVAKQCMASLGQLFKVEKDRLHHSFEWEVVLSRDAQFLQPLLIRIGSQAHTFVKYNKFA